MLTQRITPKTQTPLERRHGERRRTVMYVKVSNRPDGRLLGQLVDISPDGMLLISGSDLPLHTRWQIRIQLPDQDTLPGATVDADIETRWEKSDVNPAYRCTGCQITAIEPDDQARLQAFSDEMTFEGINENREQAD